MDRFPEKYEVFCQHYVLSRNATESAKAAGYSARSAATQGSRLLERDDVQLRISEISEEMTTDIDVVHELEKQYLQAKSNNQGQTAIKALEMLGRIRGAQTDKIDDDPNELEKDIIRQLEILGEEKVIELVSRCKWNYSQPTEEEKKEAEKLAEASTEEE